MHFGRGHNSVLGAADSLISNLPSVIRLHTKAGRLFLKHSSVHVPRTTNKGTWVQSKDDDCYETLGLWPSLLSVLRLFIWKLEITSLPTCYCEDEINANKYCCFIVVKITFALPGLPVQGLHHLVARVWSPPATCCHLELVSDAHCIVIRSSGDLHVMSWLLAWLTTVHFLLF